MLEFLLLALLLLYVISLAFLIARFRPPGMRVLEARSSPRPREPDPLRDQPLRLWIEDTDRARPHAPKFVTAFGIDMSTLRDLRVYARTGDAASLPPALVTLLRVLHESGDVHGAEIVGLLFHGRPLQDGEALYFALIDLPPGPRVVAFIDRRRD